MKRLLFIVTLMMPLFVFAKPDENQLEEVVTEKYYKTVYNLNCTSQINCSTTTEVSALEYETSDTNLNMVNSDYPTETTYKKMTTSISKNGSNYRYKVVLNWKQIPSTRSYDIIAIGFDGTKVKYNGGIWFDQYYCDGSCTTTYTSYFQIFTNGVGTVFQLPTNSNLTTLRQTFYFDVKKVGTGTLTSQKAYGDYAHAQIAVTKNQAQNFSVSTNGINLNSSIINNYDEINVALSTWSGSW